MEVKIEVKLTQRDMFSFLMKHTYSSFSGYIGVALSICALMGFCYSFKMPTMDPLYRGALVFTALLFTVIQPMMLYYRAGKQMQRNTSFAKPITYKFDTRLIEISQDEDKISFEWADVTKVTSNKRVLIIYIGRMRAFVLPFEAIGQDYDNLVQMIKSSSSATYIHLPKKKA